MSRWSTCCTETEIVISTNAVLWITIHIVASCHSKFTAQGNNIVGFNPSSMFWWTLYLNSYRITSDVRRRKHAWQIEFYVKRTNTSGNLHLKHKRESCNKNQMIYTINRTNTHNKLIQFTIRKQCTHTNENKCRGEFHSALAPWRKYRSRKQIVNDLHFTPPYTISNLQRSTPHLHRMLKT